MKYNTRSASNATNQQQKTQKTISTNRSSREWPGVRGQPSISDAKIDKLVLVLPEEHADFDAESLSERLRAVKQGSRVSSKGQAYKSIRRYRLASTASFVVSWDPRRPEHARNVVELTFNPSHIETQDIEEVERILAAIWPHGWRSGLRDLKVYRVDECRDAHGTSVANLIVHKKKSVAQAKVFVRTDRGGEIQTMYVSAPGAPVTGVVYDQVASDEFKKSVGEKPSGTPEKQLARRIPMKEAADIAIEATRFEVRRTFRQPVTWKDLETDESSSLNALEVTEIPSDYFLKHRDALFFLFCDSARLRGVAGTAKLLQRLFPKHGKKKVQEMTAKLSQLSAPWWNNDRRVNVTEVLRKTPSWQFLKYAVGAEDR